MVERARTAPIRGSGKNGSKNGHGISTTARPNRLGDAPALEPRKKPAARRTATARTTPAHHEVEETFRRGLWTAWGRPACEGAVLCFALVGAMAFLRPREPAAALELGGSSSYGLGLSPQAERLAPDLPAAPLDLGGSTAAEPSRTASPAPEEGCLLYTSPSPRDS